VYAISVEIAIFKIKALTYNALTLGLLKKELKYAYQDDLRQQ
jgi:hypothetical protein